MARNDKPSINVEKEFDCYVSTADLLRPKKKTKSDHLSAVSLGFMWGRNGSKKPKDLKRIKILFDSGCSATIINKQAVKKLRKKKSKTVNWTTKAGNLQTNEKCKIVFSLPEFHPGREIEWDAYVDPTSSLNSRYDMIIGRDLLMELGIDILFSEGMIKWDNATAPMRSISSIEEENIDALEEEILFAQEPDTIGADRIQEIIDQKYTEADLPEVVSTCNEINKAEQEKLLRLLEKYKQLFDGSLGFWNTNPVDLELKDPNCAPYHARPFPVPYAHEQKLKEEIERLVKYGVLRKINRSEWACPMFTIPKPDGTLRSLADLRELNKRIKRKPYPLPKITDLLQKLEGFMWATSLDLNMGYYHIHLTPNASRLCTVVLPWGKYEYLRLPMGLCNAPDIFQEKMNDLMQGLEFCRAYLDDLLVISKGNFEDHLEQLEQVLSKLSEAGLRVNATKSSFCSTQLKYLGYIINRQGMSPLPKKVDAILQMKAPSTKRELRKFIGMVNFYRDMWPKRSENLAPLTTMTSKNAKFNWTEHCNKSFEDMKNIIAKQALLAYPDFTKEFHIHTDASKVQLGACISQDGKPLAFYSRKLLDAQTRYTTTERELLAIVETLKEFRNILLGQKLIIHTDHANLTYKNLTSDRVMCWRLALC